MCDNMVSFKNITGAKEARLKALTRRSDMVAHTFHLSPWDA